MTREEEIDKAAKRCVNNCTELSNRYSIDENDLEDFFVEGAEWADKHPKSPWISVKDDLPCNHPELMSVNDNNTTKLLCVCYENNQIDFDYMRKICGKEWVWGSYYTPKYWCILPEPPKE